MNAFNNNSSQKAERLAEAKHHTEMDMLIKGTYGEGEFGESNFKGCSIGCLYNGAHEKGANKDSIPVDILYLADNLFESLPAPDYINWHTDWIKAIPVGADLSLVKWKFLHWLIHDKKDGVFVIAGDELKAIITKYEYLLTHASKGNIHPAEEFSKAARAAWAVRVVGAAEAVRVVGAAWAAGDAGAIKQAAKLIEILESS